MYSTNEKYKAQIIASNRAFSVRITFNASTVLTGTTIQDMTLDEVVNSADVLTMGCACSHKMTVSLIDAPTDIDYQNSSFTAEVGLEVPDSPKAYVEWVPLGTFYVSDVETANDFKTLKLTAYDGFCKMTGIYNATVPAETTLQALYNDFKEQLYSYCGVVLKARTCPSFSMTYPFVEVTYQQAAAYIAGALGAERLIMMTDIAGILRDKDDPSTLIPEITIEEAGKLYEEGVITGGMIPKVDCCIEALHRGVKNVIIMDGRVPHSILMELLTDEGAGTMVKGE